MTFLGTLCSGPSGWDSHRVGNGLSPLHLRSCPGCPTVGPGLWMSEPKAVLGLIRSWLLQPRAQARDGWATPMPLAFLATQMGRSEKLPCGAFPCKASHRDHGPSQNHPRRSRFGAQSLLPTLVSCGCPLRWRGGVLNGPRLYGCCGCAGTRSHSCLCV